MRKIYSIAFAAMVTTGSAMAADMPVKAPVYKAPPVVVAWTWDGFYVGGHVGYSWGNWDSTCPFTNCFVGTPGNFVAATAGGNVAAIAAFIAAFTNTADPKVDGWIGGAHAGRNWQYQNWVVGIEADFDWSGERDTRDGTVSASIVLADTRLVSTVTVENEWKLRWLSTIRGRLGWANDTWLLYATGGLALGRVSYSATTTVTLATTTLGGTVLASATSVAALSESTTRAGFAVGAGLEKMFDRNWIARAEYLYVDFGTYRFFDGVTANGARVDTDVRLRDHIVRVGFSYLFNNAVVAKY